MSASNKTVEISKCTSFRARIYFRFTPRELLGDGWNSKTCIHLHKNSLEVQHIPQQKLADPQSVTLLPLLLSSVIDKSKKKTKVTTIEKSCSRSNGITQLKVQGSHTANSLIKHSKVLPYCRQLHLRTRTIVLMEYIGSQLIVLFVKTPAFESPTLNCYNFFFLVVQTYNSNGINK